MSRMCVIVIFIVCFGDFALAGEPVCTVAAVAGDARVNINTADAATLADKLKGVGLRKAEAIVAMRQAKGKFSSLQQLDEVKGIGPGILEKNRDRIVFKD
ncbi:MAG: ComEA family DNA-binding protein [Fluviicoccus sp.]|uniref:ComEA family DNA-binding protein n=1 Tax=Fluviicoccus sp. TaxID=2003552 RepID=UPI002727F981|nr:ComEA family DNA-binding protein [Fluviicoccus sp.]MDO8331428.1 ComEA family DNA-binding protein [Fluviicoccus sp.]